MTKKNKYKIKNKEIAKWFGYSPERSYPQLKHKWKKELIN